MDQNPAMKIIAHIESDFSSKFGIPRQSGLVEELTARVIFTPDYRNPDAVRGLEDFSHLWLIWQFSQAVRDTWSPTVRPPRLGGNRRMGVFATRSPFRPNPIGLSCVKLQKVEPDTPRGPVLTVCGADLMNGTPIYDIKPYLPYADSQPDAIGGFTATVPRRTLQVVFPDSLLASVPVEKQVALTAVLAQDPRPSYQEDPDRIYGFCFAGLEVHFRVAGTQLTVCDISRV